MKNIVKIYTAPDGKVPVIDWLESLDKQVRYRAKERLDRVTLGNMGDHRAIDQGIWELRLTFGQAIEFIMRMKKIVLFYFYVLVINQANVKI